MRCTSKCVLMDWHNSEPFCGATQPEVRLGPIKGEECPFDHLRRARLIEQLGERVLPRSHVMLPRELFEDAMTALLPSERDLVEELEAAAEPKEGETK